MMRFVESNYHTHTFRCQHAEGSERDYIEAAIEMGVKKLGFSDHVPCPFSDGYVSRIRMTMEEAPQYVETIRNLSQEYKGQIELFVGFEMEFIPEFFERQLIMCHDLNVDYLIMGQHFWESEAYGPYAGRPTMDDTRIRAYVDSVIAGMNTGKFSYLCHPDLICFQGLDSVYEWEMTRLCQAMKKLGIPLEINMGGMGEGKHYPDARFWTIAKEIGNEVVIGVDAHSKEMMLDADSFIKCMNIVNTFDLNLLSDVKLIKP